MKQITPEMNLAMDRRMGRRDPKDGQPYYCKACGLGWNEYGACEELECELETLESAAKRHVPSVTIPPIVGFNIGDYSDIMDEPR